MMITDDFLDELNEWKGEIPNISNEAAYVLAEFVQALLLWIDNRYYTQISAHLKEITKDRYNPDAPWETIDEAIDDPLSSND